MQRGNFSNRAEHNNRPYVDNIILIGLMGAGKTTIGKLLANSMGKIFIDSDHEIQRRTGVDIPLIFEFEGEAGFRKREVEVLQDVARLSNIVLATGGGAVLREENRELLRKSGTVIYLRVPVNELKRRTRFDKNRPLLQTANPQARLVELFNQRDPLYQQTAHIILDSGRQSVRVLVQTLIKKLEAYHLSRPIMPSND
ncbi:shikimate kinase [Nitrosomonas mobilis]|uniref:Shikimate kinase n=1 Tax=Nitrosomonas mobilis TaxID=51642 RepID=A0A1G5SI45_9PROT|nr:shikimate kinase [Nitrosomonas mobilis]SCZ86886.1 Shikimate kinase [Nitrosomonas mobilis]HNO74082.1 shikimate kinase [Nitrosomonas mobilis]